MIVSCDSIHYGGKAQGVIEYDVTYLQNNSSVPTNLLPKKVTLKFKNTKSITSIDGFMGMFSVSNIADIKKRTNTVVLRVMDNRYYHPGEKNEELIFFKGLNTMKIKLLNEQKLIAGLNCKKALVTFTDPKIQGYDLYFTDSIKIENPNRANPYEAINGILMEFNLNIENVEMRLVATKYTPAEIPDNTFEIPDNYKKVSQEKMATIVTKLLE